MLPLRDMNGARYLSRVTVAAVTGCKTEKVSARMPRVLEGTTAGVGTLADATDEVRAPYLAPEQLACGGAPEDGGGIGARRDLEQEVHRELWRRRHCSLAAVDVRPTFGLLPHVRSISIYMV
jgi:hypothetical protein